MKTRTRIRVALGASLLLWVPLLAGTLAYGQTDRATITGFVSDQSAAVLAGAAVKVVKSDTRVVFTTTTNQNGVYSIPGLPVGVYTLEVSARGFKTYSRADISPMASQVVRIDVRMEIGRVAETISVTGAPPLLETQTSTEAFTMEETAIRELPLDASGGRDATTLLLSTSPNVVPISGAWTVGMNGVSISGGFQQTNSAFVDGVNASSGYQGSVVTPGLEALEEMQLQTNVTDVELAGTSGGAMTYVLKSGTTKFHGSAFEILQNEALNANDYANNQWLTTCAKGDAACRSLYSRPRYRFNDYGGSIGGPIWKNKTFFFVDYEYYNQIDYSKNPTGTTVPTTQMLTGDFSQLLTQGAKTGTTGVPNPCTPGLDYQYGQIFDPQTTQTINGMRCATPFPNNIIPSNRISATAQKVAAIYSKYYQPTNNSVIGGNFPSYTASNPEQTKKMVDVKVDHNFSDRHHISASYNLVSKNVLSNWGPFQWSQGPFSSFVKQDLHGNTMFRVVDNYSLTPTLANTFSVGFSYMPVVMSPKNQVGPTDFGLDAKFNLGSTTFPSTTFSGYNNGASYTNLGLNWDIYQKQLGYHLQDTVNWQNGRHSIKFGFQWESQQLNAAAYALREMNYSFNSATAGPIDSSLTPSVGSPIASMMLGQVSNGSQTQRQSVYPRENSFALFAQDNYKVKPKLTLNLGLRWDVTLPRYMKDGGWQNFDLSATNPNWAPVKGAWVFAKSASENWHAQIPLNQFGPHVGFAYQLTSKLVARASYGLFWVPLDALSAGPLDYLAAGTNQVLPPGNAVGVPAFSLDNGYPGKTIRGAQDSSNSFIGIYNPVYYTPYMLKLGHTQNIYAGIQYELAKGVMLDSRYLGNRGGGLHDYGRSYDQSYPSWNVYQPLFASGNVYTQINNASDAAAVGVPYPYPGFSGPAYSAIAPYPQVSSAGYSVQSLNDPKYTDVSAYDSFVAELKVRNTHGLYVDWSYTLSKQTSDAVGSSMSNYLNTSASGFQSPDDARLAKSWPSLYDQRHLFKGYLTYELPFGKRQKWLNNSALLNYVVGGWTLGFYGQYGTGSPMGPVYTTYGYQGFYSWNQRASFAPGVTASSIKNQFHGHLNLIDKTAASNNAFSTDAFVNGNAAAPFGNTPYYFNDWRWQGAATESLSLVKHFAFGADGRYQASLRGEFFDLLNRHYFQRPDTSEWNAGYTFGKVTGVSGNRRGQISARFEF